MSRIREVRTRLDRPGVLLPMRVGAMVLNVVVGVVLARTLGPVGRGSIAAAMALLAILPSLVGLGLPYVVRVHATSASGPGDLIRSVRVICVVLIVPSALLGFAASETIMAELATTDRVALLFASASTPVVVLWRSHANILYAHGRAIAFGLSGLVFPAAYLVMVVGASLLGVLSVGAAIAFVALAHLATLLFVSCRSRISVAGRRWRLWRVVRESVRFAGADVVEAAALRSDQAIAVAAAGASQAGLYSVASSVAMLPIALGQAIGMRVHSSVMRAESSAERSEAVRRGVREAVALAGVSIVLLGVSSPVLVPFLFGEDFAPSLWPTLVALGGTIPLVAANVCVAAFVALGRGWAMTVSQGSAAIIGTVLAFALGPAFGAVGLAVAASLGYLAGMAWCVWRLRIGIGSLLWSPRAVVEGLRGLAGSR